jgi:trimeric autotransporter adhesin
MRTKNLIFITVLFAFSFAKAQSNYVISSSNSTLGGAGTCSVPITAHHNTLVGSPSLSSVVNWGNGFIGVYNAAFGHKALRMNQCGSDNTAIGAAALDNNLSGSKNTGIGRISLRDCSTGSNNTALGYGCAFQLTTGSNNTFLGANINVPNNLSNTIILGDGNGNQRLYINDIGNAGFGTTTPSNKLEVKSAFTNNATTSSGLRLTNLKNTIAPIVNPSLLADKGVLSVDLNGDVILVKDIGITTNCSTANYVTKNTTAANIIGCSQIFDNGTSVGIATASNFNFNFSIDGVPPTGPLGEIDTAGVLKLDVNGVFRTIEMFATSDEKFKKNIKPIDKPLEKVMTLEGKTYNWRKDEFKDKDFTNELQYGLIAQEVQKVIPSLVIQSENGELSMNYIGLIPVLIEAMKEQQTQINDLKSRISENFKAQNQDLIELTNTKIISVSPNPSNDRIAVSFNVEKSVQSAKLQVHDLNGNVISSLNINDRENNITRTLQKDNFGKGIYIVSLVINGKSIDTKKIIFN